MNEGPKIWESSTANKDATLNKFCISMHEVFLFYVVMLKKL